MWILKGKTYIWSKWFKVKNKEVRTNAITWQKGKAIELKSQKIKVNTSCNSTTSKSNRSWTNVNKNKWKTCNGTK